MLGSFTVMKNEGKFVFTRLIDFLKSPEYDDIEQTQKARFLHIALIIATLSCLILGIQNMMGNSHLDFYLFIVSTVSFLCIPANKNGYYKPVALIISGLMIVIITYSLIAGVGLKDAGVIAYPIFITFSSYLFKKRSVLFATLLSIFSVLFVYFFIQAGYTNPVARYSNESQIKVIFVLFPATGFLFWVVVDNYERIVKNLKDTYDVTLSGWGQALEYHDLETEGHSQRVAEMTVALAKRLGIPEGKLDHIRRGALLHDIGKMAVPDAILLKKGDLSEEERRVVMLHPVHAKKFLENIVYLKPALDIPYSHHERWDGSGYPEGLSKENIPFTARIFSVVDVWDALTSDRPYRPAWPNEKVREYIRDQSGKMFDPCVVDAFWGLLESWEDQGHHA